MERFLTTPAEPVTFQELDRLLAEPAFERPAAPVPAQGEEPTHDAFDAQILAALVSP
jgi:hypothetical protein